jgi:hypothetical protein
MCLLYICFCQILKMLFFLKYMSVFMTKLSLVLVAMIVLSFSHSFSQIVYNQAKPFSYDKSGATPLNVFQRLTSRLILMETTANQK